MPLYEYRCDNCDTVFEAVRSMSDYKKPLHVGKSCPSGRDGCVARRILSPTPTDFAFADPRKWKAMEKETAESSKRRRRIEEWNEDKGL